MEEDLKDEFKRYMEYNDIGNYFALLKHFYLVKGMVTRQKGQTRFGDDVIFGATSFSSYAAATNIDSAVFGVAHGISVDELISMTRYYARYIKDDYWKELTSYINNMLDDLSQAPEEIIKNHLRDGIEMAYNNAFFSIFDMVGVDEFAKILDWDKRKFASYKTKGLLPDPAKVITATPMWTRGQVYDFIKVLKNREINKVKGDWVTMYTPQPPEQKLTFELITDDDDPNEREYGLFNSKSSYYYSDCFHMFKHETPLKEAEAIAEFLLKRVKYPYKIYFVLGMRYQRVDNNDKARECLIKAKEIIESVIPQDFNGKICDGSETYHFVLVHLAYTQYLDRNIEECRKLIERAQSLVTYETLDFSELLEELEERPDTFGKWFKEEMLDEKPINLNLSPEEIEKYEIREAKESERVYYKLEKGKKVNFSGKYRKQCQLYVPREVRHEIQSEETLFQNIIATLVTIDEFALENDPERKWEDLGFVEGGLMFKDAWVRILGNNTDIKDSVIPLEEQNLIYPLITANVVNSLCKEYKISPGNSVREKLTNAAVTLLGDRIPLEDFLKEINKLNYIKSWKDFFR